MYWAGGFLRFLPSAEDSGLSEAQAIIADLKQKEWLNNGARILLIDMQVFYRFQRWNNFFSSIYRFSWERDGKQNKFSTTINFRYWSCFKLLAFKSFVEKFFVPNYKSSSPIPELKNQFKLQIPPSYNKNSIKTKYPCHIDMLVYNTNHWKFPISLKCLFRWKYRYITAAITPMIWKFTK